MSLLRQSSSGGIYPAMVRPNLRPTGINSAMAFGGGQKPFNPRGGNIFGTNPNAASGILSISPRGRPSTNGSNTGYKTFILKYLSF